ncbi:unnamed protein product [Colias eurytheme]|nr:unnamed protein product [Colias eurytheme]
MSRERMHFRENLKKACETKNTFHSSGTRQTESPVPVFTEAEKSFWANNNPFEDGNLEDLENIPLENYDQNNTNLSHTKPQTKNTFNKHTNPVEDIQLNKLREQDNNVHKDIVSLPLEIEDQNRNISIEDLDQGVIKTYTVLNTNEDQDQNTSSYCIEDHNASVCVNSDPMLSSNNGPDSCVNTLINLESVPQSPIILTLNTPVPCIGSLLDLDGINSIPPSPLETSATGSSLLPIHSPLSIEMTTSSNINNREIKEYKGKGRREHKNEWKDIKRKANRNSGKIYTTIFDRFWGIGSNVRQWDFIAKYCKKITKRRRPEMPSRRQNTITYSLPTADVFADPVSVCKVMFLNTLGIGAGMVTTALKKVEDGNGVITPDGRGGANNRKLIIDSEMINSVCDHVNCFHPVESHYVRSRTSKLYLDEGLSYSRMFMLYKEWIHENASKYSNPARTIRQYRDIVNNHFNIGFHAPRKDQCDICHVYKNSPKPVPETEFKTYSDHIRNKEIARALKNKYKEISISDYDKTLTTTYDFQKIHGIPHGQASILYYKRKLSVFNLTFYSLGQKEGTCYVWDETVAKKGATEVASCVYKYISEHRQKGILNFNFISDNCGGQNRNRIVFLAYLLAARNFKVTITHTFLERGHTQNEGDSVHALIERCAKNKMIYIPDDWYNMIRWAKQDDKPYNVVEMQTSEFIDFKKLLSGPNWVTNVKGDRVFWSQIRQLQVLPNETDRIYYKTDFCSHEYDSIILYTHRQLNPRRRQRETVGDVLCKAYLNKFPVPKNKFQDLKYLCDHQIIPGKYHSFYQSLVPGGNDEAEMNDNF